MTKPARRTNVKTSVGGQAVMEGIMMRGPHKWCLSVRTPTGEIVSEVHDVQKRPWAKVPFIRGVFNFIDSMIMGYNTLMRSAELSMEDGAEQTSKFDAWVERKFGDKGMKIMMVVASFLGLALAVVLFMFLPTAIVSGVNMVWEITWAKALIEGVIKIVLFIIYLAWVGRMPEIRRVFAYHGAEHKTIFCYEAGAELSVENIREHSRFHPRCGTSFIFIVLLISILMNSILPWPVGAGGALLRTGLKLLMLPVIMGVSYEILRLAGKYDNAFMRAVSAPGMWLQRLTTQEPDDDMIEVAIAAVSPVLPENPQEALY